MKLPKTLPSTDRSAITTAIRVLKDAGYEAWQAYDPDEGWIDIPSTENEVLHIILDLDDSEVMFQSKRHGAVFWIRFVMGNDPSEVICDHSFKEEGEAAYDAYQAIDGLINHWIKIESEAL